MPDAAKMAVAQAFGINTMIKEANFANCNLDDSFAQAMSSSLLLNQALLTLDLSGNSFSEDGIMGLFESLKKNQSLKTLKIGTQKGKGTFSSRCANFLISCLEENHSLVNLDFIPQETQAQERIHVLLQRNGEGR